MINTDVKITRPVIEVLKVSDLKEGELFIPTSCVDKDDILKYIRCAVCYDEDADIQTVKPFQYSKDELTSSSEVGYLDRDTLVHRIEIVASELKIVK